MPRYILVWLVGTGLLSAVASLAGWWFEDDRALRAIMAGILVSLTTMLICITAASLAAMGDPLKSVLIETCLRLAVPLTFLLILKVLREELITTAFVSYFFPFQILTIVATAVRSADRVNSSESTDA